jgi:phosphoribosylformylglycinamidine synthase subunit PurS
MKNYSAEVIIMLHEDILDAQGKTIESSLHSLGFNQLSDVKVGKVVNMNVNAEDIEIAEQIVEDATNKLLANTIVESYTIDMYEDCDIDLSWL